MLESARHANVPNLADQVLGSHRHGSWRRHPRGAPLSDDAVAAAVARVREAAQQPSPAEQMERFAEMLDVPTPDLRARSGRLDAKQVAAAFGLSLRQLATALPISSQALSETPDSPKAQPVLHAMARILAALRVILPNETTQRAWLQTPNSRWQNRSPLDVMLAGKGETVARVLEIIRDGGVGG